MVDRVSSKLNMSRDIVNIIYNRLENKKIKDKELEDKVLSTLYPKPFKFNKLKELKDIDKATTILQKHIDNNSRIVLITDYDCDGISCSAVGKRYFRDVIEHDIEVYVNRRKYGNGVNDLILDTIDNLDKIDLLITADHGSGDTERYKRLKDLNPKMEIIVTDHHECSEHPQHVEAFINCKRDDNEVYRYLSGCGIFCCLLESYTRTIELTPHQLDLWKSIWLSFMALTTVSDVMDLGVEDNRYIVKKGIPLLYRLLNLDRTKVDLDYLLIPMINTGNRMHIEDVSYKFLTCTDDTIRDDYYDILESYNKMRKDLTSEAYEKVKIDPKKHIQVVTINTTAGINGIIASKASGEYETDIIVLQDDGGEYLHGSCRTIQHDIVEVLSGAYDQGLLLKYGGHKNAGGCTLHKDNLDKFVTYIDNYKSAEKLPNTKLVPDIVTDKLDVIKYSLLQSTLEPYGNLYRTIVYQVPMIYEYTLSIKGRVHMLCISNGGDDKYYCRFLDKHNELLPGLLRDGKRYTMLLKINSNLKGTFIEILKINLTT